MCGIAGYVGNKLALPIVMQELSNLEYRGYDSAGVALNECGKLEIQKSSGKLVNLNNKVINKVFSTSCAIGHTRWATHGEPNNENAHPHCDFLNKIAVVHNGIIENHLQLKTELKNNGVRFSSETDTEIIPHLLAVELKEKEINKKNIILALHTILKKLKGSYALAIIINELDNCIFVAKNQSPLIIGCGNEENFIASDVSALLSYTNKTIYLNDGELGVIETNKITIYDNNLNEIKPVTIAQKLKADQVMLGNYKHFMEKEIDEDGKSIIDTINELELNKTMEKIPISILKNFSNINIVACGTALHAGMVAKYILEKECNIPVVLDYASEFRYKNPSLDENSFCVFISQSGETADTLACMELCKQKKAFCLAITNVIGSRITRLADFCVYTFAGVEIAVASTKAYIAQLTALYCLILKIAELYKKQINYTIKDLLKVADILENNNYKSKLNFLVEKISSKESAYFIGRGLDYLIALEGALKLKEISYIHCEALPAGELKHGSLALITHNSVVVVILTQQDLIEKTLNAIYEIKSRGAYVVLLSQFDELEKEVDYFIKLPSYKNQLMPLICAKPLQQLAYLTAIKKGNDPDKPRNLAKSVTVE